MTAVYRPVEGTAATRFRQSIPIFRLMPDEPDIEHIAAVFYLPAAYQTLAQDQAMGGQ